MKLIFQFSKAIWFDVAQFWHYARVETRVVHIACTLLIWFGAYLLHHDALCERDRVESIDHLCCCKWSGTVQRKYAVAIRPKLTLVGI